MAEHEPALIIHPAQSPNAGQPMNPDMLNQASHRAPVTAFVLGSRNKLTTVGVRENRVGSLDARQRLYSKCGGSLEDVNSGEVQLRAIQFQAQRQIIFVPIAIPDIGSAEV